MYYLVTFDLERCFESAVRQLTQRV